MQVGEFGGYPIYISSRASKKYMAIVNGRRVHFGARGMDQFYDKMGHYSANNHLDPERRRRYYKRHGQPGPPGTASWFAANVLW